MTFSLSCLAIGFTVSVAFVAGYGSRAKSSLDRLSSLEAQLIAMLVANVADTAPPTTSSQALVPTGKL